MHLGVGDRLKKARKDARLTRHAVSMAANLTSGAAAAIEEGSIPRLDTIEQLARALNLSPSFLAYGQEGPAPEPGDLRCLGCGGRVTQLRQARGLGRRALARAAGTSDTAIRTIEESQVMPTVATVERLAVALGCSPGWLAYGQGQAPDDVSAGA